MTQKQKNINLTSKNGLKIEQTFLQRSHTNGQQAYEKTVNTTNHQGNVNQNYNEISHHTC